MHRLSFSALLRFESMYEIIKTWELVIGQWAVGCHLSSTCLDVMDVSTCLDTCHWQGSPQILSGWSLILILLKGILSFRVLCVYYPHILQLLSTSMDLLGLNFQNLCLWALAPSAHSPLTPGVWLVSSATALRMGSILRKINASCVSYIYLQILHRLCKNMLALNSLLLTDNPSRELLSSLLLFFFWRIEDQRGWFCQDHMASRRQNWDGNQVQSLQSQC